MQQSHTMNTNNVCKVEQSCIGSIFQPKIKTNTKKNMKDPYTYLLFHGKKDNGMQ